VNKRLAGSWGAISDTEEYIIVANSFIAGGKDGYATFPNGAQVNTYIEYSQGLIDYAKDISTLVAPPIAEWSTQGFKSEGGEVYSTKTSCTWPSGGGDGPGSDDTNADAAFAVDGSASLLAGVLATFLLFWL